MAQKNQSGNTGNRAPQKDKEWVDESDSPIELAKAHPFTKKKLQACQWLQFFAAGWALLYHFDVWQFEMDSMLDFLHLTLLIVPPIVALGDLHTLKTSKVREVT